MQASSFLSFALLPFLLTGAMLPANPQNDPAMHPLRNFESHTEEPAWAAQNDGVMGGVSTGGATLADGKLVFQGEISLENNGGFAQIYSPAELSNFAPYTAIRLRVKGDGRTYQFRLATDDRFRGSRIAYRAEFATQEGAWSEVSIPLDSFRPSHHGRMLSGPPLDPTNIRQIALLLGDGVAGPFHLEVDWIGLE